MKYEGERTRVMNIPTCIHCDETELYCVKCKNPIEGSCDVICIGKDINKWHQHIHIDCAEPIRVIDTGFHHKHIIENITDEGLKDLMNIKNNLVALTNKSGKTFTLCPPDADTTPNELQCGAKNFYVCTRLAGHRGNHHAHGRRPKACKVSWPVSDY